MFAVVARIGLACAALLAASFGLSAETFPTKFVKIVIASPPGGVQDQLSRQIGAALSAMWGQPVIIENKVGGGGLLAIEAVRQAPPDGYTILLFAEAEASGRLRQDHDAGSELGGDWKRPGRQPTISRPRLP